MPPSLRPPAPATHAPASFAPLEPLDEPNRRLVEHVHPPTWTNPRPKDRYHLVVIGAGTAGLVTAAGAAGLGAKVALVERHLMGGDCLTVGCVPSKAVIRAARAWADARGARAEFGGPSVSGEGDFAAAMERMRRLRAGISPLDGAPRFASLGVDVYFGQGRFTAPDRIEVGGAELRFRRAVIATGACAAVPSVPGLADVGYRTNETIFNLTTLPRRLVVIGGGPIGCELAQAFARFGSAVTVLGSGPRILPRDDEDAARVVAASMARDGVELELDARLTRVERRGSATVIHFEQGGAAREVTADEILLATGRAPNVEGLGLDAAGVAYDAKAGVTVDDRLRTSNGRVLAVGDIASRFQFTHAADAQARLAIANALFFGRGKASRLVIPWTTYTSPEVAHVGLSAREAAAAGARVHTLTTPLHEVDRAVLDGEDEGFFRVHLARGSDRILGATLVAEHAGDMISEITLAMTRGIGLGKLSATIHPYPTQAEVFRKTADAWRRTKLTPWAKRVLERYFRIVR
ncbi:MAG: mercuric reductase [Gemmatimonadaceae bacterium]